MGLAALCSGSPAGPVPSHIALLYSDDVSSSRMDPRLCPHVLGSCGNPPCWPVLSLDSESVFCDELTPGMLLMVLVLF